MLHGHLTERAVCIAAIVVVLAVLALLVLMLGRRRKSYRKLLADAGWRSTDVDEDWDQSGQNQNRKRVCEKAISHNTSGEHGVESTNLSRSSMASGVITPAVSTSAMDVSAMQDCDKAESQKNGDLQEHRLTEVHGVEFTTCLREQGRCLANLEQRCEEEVHHIEELHLMLVKATNSHKQLVRQFEHESRAHTERALEAINKRPEKMRQALEEEQAKNNDLAEKLREAEWAVTAKVTELKETHRIELEVHETKLRQSIEVLEQECRQQIERAEEFQKRLEQSDLFHEQELRQALHECADAAEAMKRKLMQEHEAEIAALRDELDDQRKESDAIVSEKSEALETLKAKVTELKETHRIELEVHETKHRQSIEVLEQECRQQIERAEDFQKRLEQCDLFHEQELRQALHESADAAEAMKRKLMQDHEAEIAALRDELDNQRKERDAIVSEKSEALETLKAKMDEMCANHRLHLGKEKIKHQRDQQVLEQRCRMEGLQAAELQARLDESELGFKEKVKEILREHTQTVESMASAKRQLLQEHEAAKEDLQKGIEYWKKAYDLLLEEKTQTAESMQVKMEELSETCRRELEEERVEHHQRIEFLEKQCKEWAGTVKELQKRLDNVTRERQEEAAEVLRKCQGREEALLQLIQKHEATITALQEELRNERITKDTVQRETSQEVGAMRAQMTAMDKGHDLELERGKAEYQKQLQVVNNPGQDAVQLPQQRHPQAVQLRMQSTISTEVSYSIRRPVQRES